MSEIRKMWERRFGALRLLFADRKRERSFCGKFPFETWQKWERLRRNRSAENGLDMSAREWGVSRVIKKFITFRCFGNVLLVFSFSTTLMPRLFTQLASIFRLLVINPCCTRRDKIKGKRFSIIFGFWHGVRIGGGGSQNLQMNSIHCSLHFHCHPLQSLSLTLNNASLRSVCDKSSPFVVIVG